MSRLKNMQRYRKCNMREKWKVINVKILKEK